MLTGLNHRLAALEKANRPRGITIIRISGGFTDSVAEDHGSVGDLSLYRQPDETALGFLDRLVNVAKAGGHEFVVIGG